MSSLDLTPFVSVVIPTYNRAAMLSDTLQSLVRQSYDPATYEIVVVDNNSSDATRDVVKEWQRKTNGLVKYVFEERQGVHYARNVAIQHTRGDILYYTDDDMIADRDLLTEIVKPFLFDERVGTVTGRVLPKWTVEPPAWVLRMCANYLLSLHDRPERLLISPHQCGVISCHQAIRREAFVKAGGFNPENTAGEWIGDGETGLNIKLKACGYLFGYTNSSITYHVIPIERMTQKYLNKRLANEGNCDSYTEYRRQRHTRLQLVNRIFSHCKMLFVDAMKLAVKVATGRASWRLSRARLAYHRNRIAYDTRLITDASWRQMVVRDDWL